MESSRNILAADPTAKVEVHRVDNRFVPIRACDLLEVLANEVHGCTSEGVKLRCVAAAMSRVIDQEISSLESPMCDLYAHFNPDRDTIPCRDDSSVRCDEGYASLGRQLSYVFDKANFERLTEVQIRAAVKTANSYGLRVRLNPERVEDLTVWVRGRGAVERRRRTWRAPVRGASMTVPIYRRLAVLARLKNDPHVVLKLFKDIPIEDVEALLPHGEVTMNWFDRLKVVGGGAGTIGSTAGKIVGAAALGKLAWVVLIGAGTLAIRTFLGYRRARRSRDSQRTRHLYYQNLTNNAGVIHSLLAMIAQEELKEALLAYAFCAAADEGEVLSKRLLEDRIETYLERRFNVRIDFDMSDALETVGRLGLWSDESRMRVSPPDEALAILDEHWCKAKTGDYHVKRAENVELPDPPARRTPKPEPEIPQPVAKVLMSRDRTS